MHERKNGRDSWNSSDGCLLEQFCNILPLCLNCKNVLYLDGSLFYERLWGACGNHLNSYTYGYRWLLLRLATMVSSEYGAHGCLACGVLVLLWPAATSVMLMVDGGRRFGSAIDRLSDMFIIFIFYGCVFLLCRDGCPFWCCIVWTLCVVTYNFVWWIHNKYEVSLFVENLGGNRRKNGVSEGCLIIIFCIWCH